MNGNSQMTITVNDDTRVALMNLIEPLIQKSGAFSRENPNVPLKHNPWSVLYEQVADLARVEGMYSCDLHNWNPVVTTDADGNIICAECEVIGRPSYLEGVL